MKTIKVRVGWTTRHVTYMDVEVDEEDFDGTFASEEQEAIVADIFQQAEEWIDEESYDYTVEVTEE